MSMSVRNHPLCLSSLCKIALVCLGSLSIVLGIVHARVEAVAVASHANDPAPVVSASEGRRSVVASAPLDDASSVSGYVFFDSNNDGTRDGSLDVGVDDISVSLFACADNDIVNATMTDASGGYAFEGLSGGPYYVRIPSLPSKFHAFSSAWNGATDENGALLYPNADSATNPDTGNTECFDLAEGEDNIITIGIKLVIPPVDGLFGSPATTPSPTSAPSNVAVVTSAPTTNPTPGPISLPLPATFPPTEGPSESSSKSATSSSPTRSGDLVGPAKTEGLVMTIRGINMLEDEEAWSVATGNYIMSYFNLTNDDLGAFDVTVSINATHQNRSHEVLPVRRRLSSLQDRKSREPCVEFENGEEENRGDNNKRWLLTEEPMYVEVTYDQTSAYRTPDPERYDGVYVATTPFLNQQDLQAYASALRALSAHYKVVSSVEMGGMDPATHGVPYGVGIGGEILAIRDSPNDDGSEQESDGTRPAVIVVAVAVTAGAILVAVLVLIVLRRRKRSRKESLEPARDYGPPSNRSQINDDLESGLTTSNASPASFRTIQVLAPAGKLGVVVDGPASGGPVCVHQIKFFSPILGKIRLGDKIVAVDDEDVRAMSAVDVSRLLGSKGWQEERKITVLRKVDGGDDGAAATSSEVIVIVAPAGKLGVSVQSDPESGPAHVSVIEDYSPIFSEIRLLDEVVAVDDDDVREMKASDVSKLLMARSRNPERKITVLREVVLSGIGYREASDFTASDGASPLPPANTSTRDAWPLAAVQSVRFDSPFSHEANHSATGHSPDQKYAFTPPVATSGEDAPLQLGEPFCSSSQGGDTTSANIESNKIVVIAPFGKLGLMVDSDPEHGPSYVSKIKENCPIKDQIHVGDELVAVDDVDVMKMNAVDVSILLAKKSNQTERKITVLSVNSQWRGFDPSWTVT